MSKKENDLQLGLEWEKSSVGGRPGRGYIRIPISGARRTA